MKIKKAQLSHKFPLVGPQLMANNERRTYYV